MFAQGRPIIGCFCAASNVTGILNDDLAITALLHSHGALAFWDYATAAPYVNIDMNPRVEDDRMRSLLEKDAVFFSVHKFVGGVQTPGVLVAKKKLFRADATPNGAGGGSVFFVGREDHRYLQDAEMREEGGTPAIVEGIRAGMAMQLKQSVGSEFITSEEDRFMGAIRDWMKTAPNFVLLGSHSLPRLPVLSFLIRHPETGAFLHHNFVCALLNDLFGIQSRGGCACAGPYAQAIIGIDSKMSDDFERILIEDKRLDRTHLRRGQGRDSPIFLQFFYLFSIFFLNRF
jgi:selenocysteine lyase/cysteine desulfurase